MRVWLLVLSGLANICIYTLFSAISGLVLSKVTLLNKELRLCQLYTLYVTSLN